MFGISDPGIWLAYLLEILCLVFGAWYGIKYWNQDDDIDSSRTATDILKPKTSKSTKSANKPTHN